MSTLLDTHPEIFKKWPQFQSEKSRRRWLAGWEQKQANMRRTGRYYHNGKWVKLTKKQKRKLRDNG
jgi:hypothetical protein